MEPAVTPIAGVPLAGELRTGFAGAAAPSGRAVNHLATKGCHSMGAPTRPPT
jgi:hypothetical protein